MSDKAEKLAILKARFERKLAERVSTLIELAERCVAGQLQIEEVMAARFAAHDLAGSAALFGFVEEGKRAAEVEAAILVAVRAERELSPDEAHEFLAAVSALEQTWQAGLSS